MNQLRSPARIKFVRDLYGKTPYFVEDYYLANFLEDQPEEPLVHFHDIGWRQKLNPSTFFDVAFYLTVNVDVARAGVNPLQHYIKHGWKEGRSPHPDFVPAAYFRAHSWLVPKHIDPAAHCISNYGSLAWFEERRRLSKLDSTHPRTSELHRRIRAESIRDLYGETPYFVGDDYLANFSEGQPEDPLVHFHDIGWRQKLNPSTFFDVAFYLAANVDVARAGVNPLQHYIKHGWKEGRSPHPDFVPAAYFRAHPWLVPIDVDPAAHCISNYGSLAWVKEKRRLSKLVSAHPRTTDPTGQIGFRGFRGSNAGRALERARVTKEIPQLLSHQDVFLVPGLESLYDNLGSRIDQANLIYAPGLDPKIDVKVSRWAPHRIDLPQTYDVVEDEVLFVGAACAHYGHFLTDAMARFWALPFVSDELPILYNNRGAVHFWDIPFIRSVLDGIGIDPNRVLSPRRPTLFRKAVLPLPSIQYSALLYSIHQDAHLKTAHRLLRDVDRAEFKRPFYISRSAMSDNRRRSDQEHALEERLRREGFVIVKPERLPLKDQIAIFNHSPVVAGMTGSAFHNSLFSLGSFDGLLAMLCWDELPARQLMIDKIKNYRSVYLKTITVERDEARIPRSAELNVDLAMALLDDEDAFLNRA